MRLSKYSYYPVFILSISAILFTGPTNSQAQVLEEIVVTAQRREQSLQEVPIAVELYTGQEILDQGYRDIAMLANYAPGLIIEKNQSQGGSNAYIRGFGTSGLNLTIVQAAPTFVDMVNQSRISQSMLAYLDVAQVEVLKGPQPIYFGQNATAGAFSITTQKPTREWEGYMNAELGFFGGFNSFRSVGNHKLEGAVGGPITDTIAMRFAGKYEASDGHLIDIVSQRPVGYYTTTSGRLSMDWTPNDNFTTLAKVEMGYLSQDPEGLHVCATDGAARFNRGVTAADINDPTQQGSEESVWIGYPDGSGTEIPHKPLGECFESRDAMPRDAQAPPWWMRTNGSDTGSLDVRRVIDEYTRNFNETSREGILPREDLEPVNAMISMNYQFANDIEASFLTSYQYYNRNLMRPNRFLPFIENVHHRQENLDQWNYELRLSSPAGGTFEWMVGAAAQDEELDLYMYSFAAELRQGHRINFVTQSNLTLAGFGSFTYNMTDQFAVDVGVRYTDAEILTDANATAGAQYIFDERPCVANVATDWLGPEFANMNPATCTIHPNAIHITNPADATFLLSSAPGPRNIDLNNLYYMQWLGSQTRRIPPNWRSPLNSPVGIIVLPGIRNEINVHGYDTSESDIDPQIVVRYNHNEDTSFFAKYATAWKAGGIDTGVGSIAADPLESTFYPEYATTFEGGIKGRFWDRRASYEIIAYQTVFKDLQTGTSNPFDDGTQGSFVINAGKQRVRGIDFGVQAVVTDQLRLGVSGAWMDAELTDFPNAGCTEEELAFFEDTGCDPVTGTINRSGQTPARSPKFVIAGNADYWIPFREVYQWSFGVRTKYGTSYHSEPNSFSRSTMTDAGMDASLTLGFGDMDGVWKWSLSARNLLERRSSYHPEFTINPTGTITSARLSENEVKSFALQYRHNLF